MTQLGLKPGVDIDTVALNVKQGVQKIGEYDKRGIAPLKNPQKKWALDVPEEARIVYRAHWLNFEWQNNQYLPPTCSQPRHVEVRSHLAPAPRQ